MSGFFGFVFGLIKLFVALAVVLGVVALIGYNRLRRLSEDVREAWSNIGVVAKKQASLVNQLIDVVKGYQESEKLVMLKVSDDMTSAASVASLHQQAGTVVATAAGLAQRFPELKADRQYQRLIDSIQSCEAQLEEARQIYNRQVKLYNVGRSTIPTVFYASIIGFRAAHYLEFVGSEQVMEAGDINSFASDLDGERLNALLGQAGARVKAAGDMAVAGGRRVADKAGERIRQLSGAPDREDPDEDERGRMG